MPAQNPSRTFSLAAASMALGGLSLMASAALLMAWRPVPAPATASEPHSSESCELRCALPAGVSLDSLSSAGADYIARRAQLCADLECGRIDARGFAESVARLDTEPVAPIPERLWATSVLEVSSQYGEHDWSASQVLGAPDVYPASGDNVKAWASMNADGKDEFIEVGVPAARIGAIEIYETFNPGAIRSIDVIGKGGHRTRVYGGEPRVQSDVSQITTAEFSCTRDEVVGVRVTLNASAVAGWNEIDAIAVRPCQ